MEQIRRVMRPTDVSFSPSPVSPPPFSGGCGSIGSEKKSGSVALGSFG
jgi:hypothetical protein